MNDTQLKTLPVSLKSLLQHGTSPIRYAVSSQIMHATWLLQSDELITVTYHVSHTVFNLAY